MGLLIRGPVEPASSDSDGEATKTTWDDPKEKTASGKGATALRPHKTSGNPTGHKEKGGKEREEEMLPLCTPCLMHAFYKYA